MALSKFAASRGKAKTTVCASLRFRRTPTSELLKMAGCGALLDSGWMLGHWDAIGALPASRLETAPKKKSLTHLVLAPEPLWSLLFAGEVLNRSGSFPRVADRSREDPDAVETDEPWPLP